MQAENFVTPPPIPFLKVHPSLAFEGYVISHKELVSKSPLNFSFSPQLQSGFETVLDLIKGKLDVKHGDSAAVTTQMNVVRALVEHKKGNIKSSDVADISEACE